MKKSKKKYELGSYIKPLGATGQGIAAGGQLLGSMIGGDGGNIISGVASGAMMGGPLGAALGGIGAIVGNIGEQNRLKKQEAANYKAYSTQYQNNLISGMDTNNENPYGQVFADGGVIGGQPPKKNPLAMKPGNTANTLPNAFNNFAKYFFDANGNNNLIESPYKPSKSTNKDMKYYIRPGMKEDIYKDLTSKEVMRDYNHTGEFSDIHKALLSNGSDRKNNAKNSFPNNAAGYKGMYNNGHGSLTGEFNLGRYTVDAGEDKNGKYVSFNDVYDWNGMKDDKASIPFYGRIYEKEWGDYKKNTMIDTQKQVDDIKTNRNFQYADGGIIPDVTQINIERGELQIDPKTGKILREYTGINPETGGLYKPHSKGKDTTNNFVSAEPGTFVITSKKAKDYKDALDQNDKLRQNTILKNIINYKDSKEAKTDKFALGSYVDGDVPPLLRKQISPYDNLQSQLGFMTSGNMGVLPQLPTNAPTSTGVKLQGYTGGIKPSNTVTPSTSLQGNTNKNSLINTIGQGIGTYGNALYNIGQGMFGKVDKVNQIGITQNPYKQDILNNMPQDINFEPVRQQLLRQQNTAFNQIDNTTNGSPIARANKLNVFANTQNQLGSLMMDNQVRNNQVRGQRASIYGNLANQEMNESNRVQQLNLGIDEQNRANKGIKTQRLDKGLSQLQQAYQNKQAINQQNKMAKMRTEIMRQMFPNLKYYPNFSDEALFGS